MTPGGPDPFETLGLEAGFDLAPGEIESAYLSRVASAHPDVSTGEGADPAVLNHARGVLLDPERRAGALLERLGGAGPSEDRSLPEGFLMEIMETRVRIEEAIASGGEAERAEWEAWAEGQRAEYAEDVAGLFARARGGDGTVLAEIRRRLNAWRYIERLIEQLDPDYDRSRADRGV